MEDLRSFFGLRRHASGNKVNSWCRYLGVMFQGLAVLIRRDEVLSASNARYVRMCGCRLGSGQQIFLINFLSYRMPKSNAYLRK